MLQVVTGCFRMFQDVTEGHRGYKKTDSAEEKTWWPFLKNGGEECTNIIHLERRTLKQIVKRT